MRSSRLVAGLAALLVLVVAGFAFLASQGSSPAATTAPSRSGVLAPASPAVIPPVFVSDDQSGWVDLRSPETGRVVHRLARLGENDSTGNGLAVSANGRDAYVDLVPTPSEPSDQRGNLRVGEITVGRTGVRTIGYGDAPAVSPDGADIAYLSDAEVTADSQDARVVIQNTTTGQSESVDVTKLVGKQGNLENLSGTAWFSDDQTVIVLPGFQAEADSAPHADGAAPDDSSTSGLIEVTTTPRGQLAATDIPVSGRGAAAHDDLFQIYSDASRPNTVLAEALIPGDKAALDLIRITAGHARLTRLLTIPRALIDAIDPTGTRILYLQGHTPPALWVARISGNTLVDRKELYRRSPLGNAAW